jgi:NAD(P)-dependent dehydrogenase (short-subunit alcohol dehydrogenase family)
MFDDPKGVSWYSLDVSSASSIANFLSSIEGMTFNCIISFIGAQSSSIRPPSKYVEAHLTNTLGLLENLLPHLSQESGSALINVSSRSALYPSKDIYYSAVKGGLISGIRSLKLMVNPNSKIISIAPGLVLGSSMANDMAAEVRNDHFERSEGRLLDLTSFSEEFLKVLRTLGDYQTGTVIEIGPKYI